MLGRCFSRGLGVTGSAVFQIRFATKKAGGSTNNGRDSPGQRLGVKKFGSEDVQCGNIIMRQRGRQFHLGVNVGMGRDHTIYSLVDGKVHFHRIQLYNENKNNRHIGQKRFISVIPNDKLNDASYVKSIENIAVAEIKKRSEYMHEKELIRVTHPLYENLSENTKPKKGIHF